MEIKYLELADKFIFERNLLVGCEITPSKFITYQIRLSLIKKYLAFINQEDILVNEINLGFVKRYDIWLRTDRKLANDYIMKCIQFISRVFDFAVENEYISSNPCNLFKYRYNRLMKRNYITEEELTKIENLDPRESNLKRIRDIFIFAAYTGLSYADIQKFNYKRHTYIKDGIEWIHIRRQKTDTETLLPLLPKAKEILIKYSYKLPIPSNPTYNYHLKTIADRCRIRVLLTTHSARKTFGMIMHNVYGVSIDTVSKMLGHTSVRTTQDWYVDTTEGKILHDMKSVIEKMNGTVQVLSSS
jgi:integrase